MRTPGRKQPEISISKDSWSRHDDDTWALSFGDGWNGSIVRMTDDDLLALLGVLTEHLSGDCHTPLS